MPKLYEISSEIEAILAAVDENGELPADLSDRLDALGLSLESKADQVCRLVRQDQADAIALECESKRLGDLAKAAWGRADRWKQYVKDCLDRAGVKRLDTELFRLVVVRNSQPSVRVNIPPEELPTQYQRVRVEADSRALVEAWKAHPLVMPAGVTVEVGSHVRIR